MTDLAPVPDTELPDSPRWNPLTKFLVALVVFLVLGLSLIHI